MAETNEASPDSASIDQRDRLMMLARFAGLFIVLMIFWYSFHLADKL